MSHGDAAKAARALGKAPVKRSASGTIGKAPVKRGASGAIVLKPSSGSVTTRGRAARNGELSSAALKAPTSSPVGTARGRAADDPLAAERTRWLAEAVGGGKALAQLLGVSPSQTSRWAKGEERPGAVAAPLLIDLEHVLARVRLVWAEPAATTWMVSANAHLSGARPVDVLRLQGVGPVLDALDAAMWGGAA